MFRHTNSRGAIKKRHSAAVRVDRDGDVAMGATPGRGRGRGRGGRSHTASDTHTTSSREVARGRPLRNGINTTALQKALGTAHGLENKSIRGRALVQEAAGHKARKDGLDEVTVQGLDDSRAAANPGGGLKELITFLQRKASPANAKPNEMLRIKKSRKEGNTVTISVRSQDTPRFINLNGFTFAGAVLKIQLQNEPDRGSKGAQELKDKLKRMLERRYDAATKLLDLSFLGSDPEFVNTGMFESQGRDAKFFLAVMAICDETFSSMQHKRDSVISVSLANNNLQNLMTVTTLSQSFPDIKNLDLSHNSLQNTKALEPWRRKFRSLEHLVLSNNPLVAAGTSWQEEVLAWFPSLRLLDGVRVRTDEQVHAPTVAKKYPLPIATLPPCFNDETGRGERFLKNFFPAFDTDRVSLVNAYYDSESTFSLNVNQQAPHALQTASWEAYLKKSRNLTKITTLPTRLARLIKGADNIRDAWLSLPSTRHPDLLTEGTKWCIEGCPLPGLPDPSGQSAGGVFGLMMFIHGEYSEIDVSTMQATATRSFDRTLIIGPGRGVDGIRVVSDVLALRAYAGSDAWNPGVDPCTTSASGTLPPRIEGAAARPEVPTGHGTVGATRTEEQARKEYLEVEMSKATRMTLAYSRMCLEQVNYNPEQAMISFESVKASLPPEAFF